VIEHIHTCRLLYKYNFHTSIKYGLLFVFFTFNSLLYSAVNLLTNPGFEEGTTGWQARNCSISAVTASPRSGLQCGRAYNRTAVWQGIKQSILGKAAPGQTVTISGWVRLENTASDTIKLTVEQRDDAGTKYIGISQKTVSNSQWTQLTGQFTLAVSGTLTYLDIYFEGPAAGISFYVDDAEVLGPDSSTASCRIDISDRHQIIEGFGAAGAWYEGLLVNHPQKNTLYDLMFNQLGLEIYRIRNTFEIDSAYMDRTAQIIREARALTGRPLKIMISSWSPPAYLKSNNNTREGTLKKNEYNEYMYPEFANWWYRSLVSWASRGIAATYINIQNEPDYVNSGWDTCYLWATETSTMAGYNLAFEAVWQELNGQMGLLMPKMLAPETTGFSNIGNYISNLIDDSHVYGYAHHLYNCSNSTGGAGCGDEPDRYLTTMANFASQYGTKPLFQSEYEDATNAWPDALNLALLLHNSLTVEGVAAYLYWDLFWNSGGLITLTSSGYTLNNDYYGFKHFSAFIHSGWQRLGTVLDIAGLRISAYISPDNQHLSAVIINPGSAAVELTVSIPEFSINSGDIYRSTASQNTEHLGTFNPTDTLSIPAMSITTLSLTGSVIPPDCSKVIAWGFRLPEDLDGNCRVDWSDLLLLAHQWLTETPQPPAPNYSADLTGDNHIDLFDAAALLKQWMVCNEPETVGCIENWQPAILEPH